MLGVNSNSPAGMVDEDDCPYADGRSEACCGDGL